MIENAEIFVKLAKIDEEGKLVDQRGEEYFLHTSDCDLVCSGRDCDCYGGEVLSEILDFIVEKGEHRAAKKGI